ncbi:MAG TPA: glycogen synthase GlgA [Planctomycetota bacterium]|jgi:starch synthase
MNIAYVSSEVAPYSKTGGLGDVSGSLPGEIAALGHSVSVFTPYYRSTKKVEPHTKVIAEGSVPVGSTLVPWALHAAQSGKPGVNLYFIAGDIYFDRDGLYGTSQGDYEDSCSRFCFFCRACIAAAQVLGQKIDVWHCNDWQSALIPIYLRTCFGNHPFHASAATILTIHNIAYQGHFWHWDWPLLNLPWAHFNWKELEFHGKMNLLKGGLVHADLLTTVSPTYSREIQTAEFGYGLQGVLADRKNSLVGIVNGIDTQIWNPATDPLLPANYTRDNLEGKTTCREVLRRKFNLPNDHTTVIGMIGRLFEQKGFDLVAQSIDELLRRDIQLIILGTGREEFHKMLQRVQQSRPDRVAVAFAFDNALAHLIEAGSDIFLMPSRYEPCGLNQLYSIAYGTPPIVRRVGGLADTIGDAIPENIANGTATGFQFRDYTPQAMMGCIDWALRLRWHQREDWLKIQRAGMSQDWSWRKSAEEYVKVYQRAVEQRTRK